MHMLDTEGLERDTTRMAHRPARMEGTDPSDAPIRVLVVEDDPLLALDLEDMLVEAGFEIGGLAASVEQGLRVIEGGTVEAATLDYNLGAETSEELARVLRERSIPYCYLSAADNRELDDGSGAPVIGKPVTRRAIVETIRDLVREDA